MQPVKNSGVGPRLKRGQVRSETTKKPGQVEINRPALRARVFGAVVVVALLGLIGRLWYLQVARGDEFEQIAFTNQTRLLRIPAARGLIVDCNGHLLAANKSEFGLYAEPSVATDMLTLNRLAQLIGQTPTQVYSTITSDKKNPYDPVCVEANVPLSMVARVEEQRALLRGVSSAATTTRFYPNGSLFGDTMGSIGRMDAAYFSALGERASNYAPDDLVGKTGIEAQYENLLHGSVGGTKVTIDAKGKPVSEEGEVAPRAGMTLQMAINEKVQAAAEQVFREHNWTGGAAAINPQTGAVVALVSYPNVDPNIYVNGVPAKEWHAIETNPQHPMINRAVDAIYPPGSTFKQVVAAAGLESGAITTDSSVYCTGAIKYAGKTFHCWEVHGDTGFYKAIAQSCDIFFYNAGIKMGSQTLSDYAKQYPIGQKTGIDLPHEAAGVVPDPAWKAHRFRKYSTKFQRWYPGDTLNMSIGQGFVLVTPLQMALVTAATSNGGYVLRPYLVERIINPTDHHPVVIAQKVVLRRVNISPQNLDDVRLGMRDCVTAGTGAMVNFASLAVGAKTGSAQTRADKPTHGWFVAFAPYDHPTLACAAVVEYGGHGANSAGFVVKAMLQAYFKIANSNTRQARSD